MHQAAVGFHCPECVKRGRQTVYQGVAAMRTRPVLTQVLIAANVAVFLVGLAMTGSDALAQRTELHIDFGLTAATHYTASPDGGLALTGGVGHGEWYRMITSGFLHYGIFHLAVNMYALWILGRVVEHMGGRLRFGLVYVASILGGALGALLLDPGSLTAGASGGIFGLMGAIFLAQRAQGVAFRDSPLLMILVLNLFITFTLPGISVGGHMGGLVAGGISGWLLFDIGLKRSIDKRLPIALVAVMAVACLVGGVLVANTWMP